ncbi:MAG: hypothetical protein HC908_12365, partial [Calothrix sp. SM1_7_51]|nr:hypothetical protein [Calothrix sp. SM1_7_51]
MNINYAISSRFRRFFSTQMQPDNLIIKSQENDTELSSPKLDDNQPEKKQFNFKLFFAVVTLLIGSVSAVNWLVDPLWYGAGNRLTGKNFAFNERVSKTNLFLRNKHKNYDCLILGSSRVIALNASNFQGKTCFNYSIKGGEVPDFIGVAKFVKEQ